MREALASTGITDRFGSGRFDRLLREIRGLPRPTLLSIRNTFRRKGRLLLTLAALGLGGAIFMSVFSVRASLVKTLDDTLAYFAYDVQVELATTERTSVLVDEAMAVPGVVAAEPWRFASTEVVDAGGTEGPQRGRVRAAAQRADRPADGPGGPLAAARRRQRAGRDGERPRRRAGPGRGRHGHAADRRQGHGVDAGRDRPVPHPAAVPLRAGRGARAGDRRGRAGRRADGRRAAGHGRGRAGRAGRRGARAGSRGPASRSPRRRRRARSASRRSCCSTSSCCSCRRWPCCSASSAASGSRGR